MRSRPVLLATVLALSPLAAGCKTVNARVAASAPTYAADASIRLKPNKTGNGELVIEVEHLAPPKRIDKSYAGYVAWILVEGQPPVKLGVLDYNERKRLGQLHATTPQKRFSVKITIEQDLNASTPSSLVIIEHPIVAKH